MSAHYKSGLYEKAVDKKQRELLVALFKIRRIISDEFGYDSYADFAYKNIYHDYTPEKFTNVTNGIAHRRWLNQSNPELCSLLNDCIGEGYAKDASKLAAFKQFENDESVLKRLNEIKMLKKQQLTFKLIQN